MVRAPAHFDARERPDTKAAPGLRRRAGLLLAGIQYAAALSSITDFSGILDRPPSRTMTARIQISNNQPLNVIASEAKQSTARAIVTMDCFVASLLAMTTNIVLRPRAAIPPSRP